MTALALPAPYERIRIGVVYPRLPKWARPWERTKDDVAVAAFSELQSNHRTNGSVSGAITLAYPGAVTAGGLLVAALNCDHTGDGGVVNVPTGGGTWAQIGTTQVESVNNQDCAFFYCPNATGGATTVSFTAPTSRLFGAAFVIAEFSGVTTTTPLDASDMTKAFTTSTTVPSNSIAVTVGDLIVIVCQDSDATSSFAASGFTAGVSELGTGGSTGSVSLFWTTAGSASASGAFTLGSAGHATTQIAAFKAAAGAAAASLVTDQRRMRRNTLLRMQPSVFYMNALRPNWRPRRSGLIVPEHGGGSLA